MADSNEVTSQQGSENLQSMFAHYKKRKEVKKFVSKEEKLAKYFTPRRDKEYFRPLPATNKDIKVPLIDRLFQPAYFHEVKVGKNWKKIYCPAHNDPKVQAIDKNGQPVVDQNGKPVLVAPHCPLCKKAKVHLATQDRSIQAKVKGKKKEQIERELTSDELRIFNKNKEIWSEASKMEAKKFYILSGIDRGSEKDGKKFWRFKHNFKNKGIFDTLMSVTEEYSLQHGDFTDVNTGTDFTIIVVDSQMPGKTYTYKDVSAVIARGPSKLSTDPMKEKEWLEDKTEWRDVFKPAVARGITAQQFLELAAEGNAPYWDDSDANNKRWVFPNHPELEAAANRRDDNLDAEDEYSNYDEDDSYASAAISTVNESSKPDITTITEADVKTFNHNSTDIGAPAQQTTQAPAQQQPIAAGNDSYDDLPF